MTTRPFSYALKSKLPGGLCLIIIGTEGFGFEYLVDVRTEFADDNCAADPDP